MKQTEQKVSGILVAVYGTLRQGQSNWAYYLNNKQSQYLGSFKSEPNYTMYNLGAFPAVVEGGDTTIQLEVFMVSEDVKQSLDYLEGYTPGSSHNLYNVTDIETPFGTAKMYVMNEGRGYTNSARQIKSGDWLNR